MNLRDIFDLFLHVSQLHWTNYAPKKKRTKFLTVFCLFNFNSFEQKAYPVDHFEAAVLVRVTISNPKFVWWENFTNESVLKAL